MSIERPTKAVLVFQCDACFDNHEFSKADGDDIGNFQSCWSVLREEGWTIINSQHFCDDCSKIAKSDRERSN